MHHTNIVLRMVGTTINTIGVRIEFEYDYLHSFGFICTCTIARVQCRVARVKTMPKKWGEILYMLFVYFRQVRTKCFNLLTFCIQKMRDLNYFCLAQRCVPVRSVLQTPDLMHICKLLFFPMNDTILARFCLHRRQYPTILYSLFAFAYLMHKALQYATTLYTKCERTLTISQILQKKEGIHVFLYIKGTLLYTNIGGLS